MSQGEILGRRSQGSAALVVALATLFLVLSPGAASAAVVVHGASARLTWSAASGPVAGYNVQTSANGASWTQFAKVYQPSITVVFTPGVNMRVRVGAFDAQGHTGPWSAASLALQFAAGSPQAGAGGAGAGGTSEGGNATPPAKSRFDPSAVDLNDPRTSLADINGDGELDLLNFDTSSKVAGLLCDRLAVGAGFGSARLQLINGPSTPDMMQYADVNGDGKADALYFDTWRSSKVWVALSTGSGFQTPRAWLHHGPSAPNMIQYADVNGDGKADALYFDVWRSGKVWVALSTGHGFTDPVPWISPASKNPQSIRYADVDGDGRADALLLSANGRVISVAYSTGSSFTPFRTWTTLPKAVSPNAISYVDVGGLADALLRPANGTALIAESSGHRSAPRIVPLTSAAIVGP